MPPKATDQKRKRGRPPGASRPDQDASNSEAPGANNEPDVEEQARPKKRGRKTNADSVDTGAESVTQAGPAQPTRRGRPPKRSQQDAAGATEALSGPGKKNTGRKAKDAVKKSRNISKGKDKEARSHEAQAEQDTPSSELRRSGRERRSWNPDEVFGSNHSRSPKNGIPYREAKRAPRVATDTTKDTAEVAKTRKQGHGGAPGKTGPKRGRPALSNADTGEGRVLQPQQGNRTKAPGRPSKQAQPPVVAASEGEVSQPRRRGRPRASDGPSQASEQEDQPSEARAPGRRRPAKSREDQDGAPSEAKRKRLQPSRLEPVPEEVESSEPEEESELPFRHLREATKNIPRTTISEKWKPLDGPSINAVGAFLADAQRPVLLRLEDTNRRREHASSALSIISRRLRSKLVKGFPFPAPTAGAPTRAGSGNYEDEFNFERTVDAIQALESTLNPLQHSMGLLEREIKREEDALAKDYDSLHKLEANARSEARRWREQAKREHILAPGSKRRGEGGDDEESLELVPRAEDDASGGLFKDLEDEELVTISKQISSHMESMKGNLQQISGVVPAVIKSKAALQQVLLKHLDGEQYERVLVG
ncbi:hypothetical protein VM1G_09556 [Cytospora mali]|uniref:Kinetochore protein fta7 n=1 Tax=Cytospora mali TaxID=578113 RepID=A0A194WAW3_CYTMA|nr:hypothetical protein VM1G_09556 [Valsa mali]